MKGKPLDYTFTAFLMDQQQGTIRVTGNGDETVKLKKRDIDYI